jgi:hypothetical protein
LLALIASCHSPPEQRAAGGGDAGGAASTSSSLTPAENGSTSATAPSSRSTSSSDAGAGSDSWLERPGLWHPVGGELEKDCDIQQAKLPAEGIPRRTWTACGEGCLEAPAVLPDSEQNAVSWMKMTAFTYSDGMYYFIPSRTGKYDVDYGLVEIGRLDADAPRLLLRHSSGCIAMAGRYSPLLVMASVTSSKIGSIGRVLSLDAPLVFGAAGFPLEPVFALPFEIGDTWGAIRGWSSIQIASSAASGAVETVYQAGYAFEPIHRDDMVAWSDGTSWSTTHRVRLMLYKPDRGAFLLVQGQGDIMRAALNPDRIVWLEAKGLASQEGKFESAQVFYSPFTLDPAKVERKAGPVIPHTDRATNGFVAWGDLVGMVVGGDTGQGVVVANMVTQKVWFIPNRPGKHMVYPMGMDDKTMLVAEYDLGGAYTGNADHLIQFDLSKLDALAASAQP